MTSDSPDNLDPLDESASALLDGHLGDDERMSVSSDPLVVDRARTFASLRASLLDTTIDTTTDTTTTSDVANVVEDPVADREIVAALDVFDELFAGATAPLLMTSALAPPAPTDEAARHAPISLDAHRARRAGSRRMMTVLGLAAAIAVVVLGVSRLGGGSGSKTSSSVRTTVLPAVGATPQTSPAKRSTSATDAQAEESRAAGAALPAPAADSNSGGGDATANAPAAAAGPPFIDTPADLVTYIEQMSSFTLTTTAASATTTAASPAEGSPAAGTTAGITAGTTAASTTSVPCDASPAAAYVGAVIWQGQPATVFSAPATYGSPHRIGTVYSSACVVLTQVDVPV